MKFKAEECQKYPLDVEFKGTVKMFDMETINQAKDYASPSKKHNQ